MTRTDRFPGTSNAALAAAITLIALVCSAGCGGPSSRRVATPDVVDVLHVDTTSKLEVEVGQQVAFDLPGHAGTGYAWRSTAPCPGFLEFIDGPVFQPDDGTRLGSRGLFRFRYRVVAPGAATLQFDYVRDWEVDARPVRRSVVEVSTK